MSNYFSSFLAAACASSTTVDVRFDAERDTPELVESLSTGLLIVRDILADLRRALPLMASLQRR